MANKTIPLPPKKGVGVEKKWVYPITGAMFYFQSTLIRYAI